MIPKNPVLKDISVGTWVRLGNGLEFRVNLGSD